jgi:hypothetical protein
MLEGGLKYGRHNYRAVGIRVSVYYDALMRHIGAWWEGEDIDPESGLNHVVKALATLVVMRDAMIQDKMCDDRPPKSPDGWIKELNRKAAKLIEQYPNPVPAYLATDDRPPKSKVRRVNARKGKAKDRIAKFPNPTPTYLATAEHKCSCPDYGNKWNPLCPIHHEPRGMK